MTLMRPVFDICYVTFFGSCALRIITKLEFLTIQTSDVGPHLSYLPGLEASTSTIYGILAAQQLWLNVILSCIIQGW